MNSTFGRFSIVDEHGRELNRLNVDIMLYVNVPLRELRDQVVAAMESFYRLCPREAIGWYATETMKQFKPATVQSYELPRVWWKDGAPRKEFRELQLKGGDAHNSVATCGVYLLSRERESRLFDKSSNYVRFVLPAEGLVSGAEAFVKFVAGVSETIPFVSGHGGYVMECNQYHSEVAQGTAFPLAMRYQAVDIATMSRGPWAVRGERIKNIAWLTLVGSDLLKQIGGMKTVKENASPRLTVIETANGALIRAGESPVLGDVNRHREELQPYIDAYRLSNHCIMELKHFSHRSH